MFQMNQNQFHFSHATNISLRDYQLDCLSKLRAAISRGEKRLLVKAPCSFGKTIVFCEIARSALSKKNRTLIIVDSIALVIQTKIKMLKFVNEEEVGIYCGSLKLKDSSKLITIGTIQTLKDCVDEFDVYVMDETHEGLDRIKKYLETKPGIIIGFTATPFTAKGLAIYGQEDSFYPSLTYDMPVDGLIKRNIITPVKYGGEKEDTKINLKDVRTSMGDYSESDLQKLYEIEVDKVKKQIDDMLGRINGRNKVVIMTTGIKHANFIAEVLPDSVAYHSEISLEARKKILHDFEHGDKRFLIGVMAIYKGLDITCIDCLVNMRPTKSYPFYIQFVGRGVRNHDGKKDCLFLDYGQTIENLGFYENFKEAVRRSNKTGIAPEFYPKKCPDCLTFHHTSKKFCECGYVFERATTLNLNEQAYVREEVYQKIVRSFKLIESPMFGVKNIVVETTDNKTVTFSYYMKTSWALKLHEAHSARIKNGSLIRYRFVKGKYYNLEAII